MQAFIERRRAKTNLAVGVHRERTAVENKLILTTDDIHVDNGHLHLGDAFLYLSFTSFLARHLKWRTINYYDAFSTRRATCAHRSRIPDVLANVEPDTNALDLEYRCFPARREVALLVENAVVG